MTECVNGIVLAGGKNLRMGRNKALEKLGGQTLIERAVGRLQTIVVRIIVVTAAVQDELPSLGNTQIVPDVYPGKGPLAGIYAGLLASDADQHIVVACDMPFLNTSLLSHMVALALGHDAVIPRLENGMIEALHGVYRRTCLAVLKRRLDEDRLRIQPALEELDVLYIKEADCRRFDPELLSFFNINRPSDLDVAIKIERRQGFA